MPKFRRETRVNIKIDETLYEAFQHWCGENGTTVSATLRQFIKKTVDADQERKLKLAEMKRTLYAPDKEPVA